MAMLAKLTRPRVFGVIPRERLFAKLDSAREGFAASWVVGPPGSGKTTLVASYLDAYGIDAPWYQVDAGDRDMSTFFYYLGQALNGLPGRTKSPPRQWASEDFADLPGYARHFFRECFALLNSPGVLVIDNYDAVPPDSAFHATIVQAIGEVPDGVHVIVTSRQDPPAEYARLVAANRLARLDWEDLRLTFDEAMAIASDQLMGDEPFLRTLYGGSAGWAAGWTLSLAGSRRAPNAGFPRHGEALESIFRYFSNVVFETLPGEVQQFLLRTAVVPRLTVAIGEALSESSKAGEILADLHRRRLFVDRRGTEPYTYEYHDLLRSFLLHTLELESPVADVEASRRRAATLLAAHGHVDDAMRLCVAARDWDGLARLIVDNAGTLLRQGRRAALREWCDSIPSEIVVRSPWLSYWKGASMLTTAPVRARTSMEASFDLFRLNGDVLGQTLSATGAIQTFLVEFGHFDGMAAWIRQLERLLTESPTFPSPTVELQVYGALVFSMDCLGHSSAAIRPKIQRIEQLLAGSGIAPDQLASSSAILIYHFLNTFEPAQGRRVIDKVEGALGAAELTPLVGAFWDRCLGWHYLWEGSNAAAEEAFGRSMSVCIAHAIPRSHGNNYTVFGLAMAALDRGDAEKAESLRIQAAQWSRPDRKLDLFHDLSIKSGISALRNDWDAAIDSCERARDLAMGLGWSHGRRIASLAMACLLVEAGMFRKAESYLDSVRPIAGGDEAQGTVVDVALVESYSALRQGDGLQWQSRLRTALTLMKASGDRLGLRMCPLPASVIFAQALKDDIDTEYVCRLIRRYRVRPPTPDVKNWPWPIKIYTLGTFKVLVDNDQLEFGRKTPKKPLKLLKAIIALGGRDVAESRIADALWPDEPGDTAHNACATTLTRLRRLLGDARAIEQVGGCLSLNRDQVWVDALAFEAALDEGRHIAGPNSPDDTIRSAIDCYGGNFLADDTDAQWSVSTRERLRVKFVVAVSDVAKRQESLGEFGSAMDLYRRGIEADELTEDFYRGLMRCHRDREERAEALSVYRRLKRTLSVTLGIAPSHATEALATELLAG